jgi:hypothetical protein
VDAGASPGMTQKNARRFRVAVRLLARMELDRNTGTVERLKRLRDVPELKSSANYVDSTISVE